MTAYYLKRGQKIKKKTGVRLFAMALLLFGLSLSIYIFSPLISWQIYFAPTEENFEVPIPKTTVADSKTLQSLFSQATNTFSGIDYTNAKNWFPSYNTISVGINKSEIPVYFLSIPKLGIKDADVSTTDYDLNKHLVQFNNTAIPPKIGNAVIFGHSTLPQWFNPNDYKTIFASVYKLNIGDDIFANIGDVSYRYKVYNIKVVDPEDTSIFSQDSNDAYLTLVTCTPPGTTWKRLIIKSKLFPI